MTEIMTLIKDWVWLVGALTPLLVPMAMLYLKSQFPTKLEAEVATQALKRGIEQLSDQVEQRRGDTERRLTRLESAMEYLPSRSDMAALERRMGDVERQGAVTAEAVRGVDRMMVKVDRSIEMVLENQIKEQKS